MQGAITTDVDRDGRSAQERGPNRDDALAQERRRIAAEIHDLVMQDLSFALAGARGLAEDPERALDASTVVAAGERALTGAREIISALTVRDRPRVVEAVGAAVRAAARDTPLSFDARGVPVGAQPDPATLDALVHIGREAVTNAVKHASPTTIEVALEHRDEWRLRVRDDGRGLNADAGAAAETDTDAYHDGSSGGFGLDSMRHHAHALGGSLHVAGLSPSGTVVEVALP